MITAHHIPAPPLSDFVKVMWYWDGYVQPHAQERLLPDGCMTIAFSLGERSLLKRRRQERAPAENVAGQMICGARSTPMVLDTADMVTTLGIQFKPGGGFPFLRMPAGELRDLCVPLDDVFGAGARSLRERLLECGDPREMFAAAEPWLLSHVVNNLDKHPAVAYATQQFAEGSLTQPLSSVLDRIGYSQRHFNQLFADEVGLTPKRFLRVRRFQRVISSISNQRSVDWADLALRCGYYDQPHFVHDFRSFCGLTPAAYLACRTPHLNHVPVLD
jgi:AraC-like DNA-binding protein